MSTRGKDHVESIFSTPVVRTGETDNERELLEQKTAQFIRMRWIAAGVEVLFVYLALGPLSLLHPQVTTPLLTLITAQIIFNFAAYAVLHRGGMPVHTQLFFQFVGDLFILTGLLHFSGGVENPFLFLYLVHVILASILFNPVGAYGVAIGSVTLAATLGIGEFTGALSHYELLIYQHGDTMNPARNPYFVGGTLTTLTILVGLITYFATALMKELRESRSMAIERARSISRAKQRFETVIKASGAGVLLFNDQRELIWANEQVQQWFPEAEFEPGRPCPHLHESSCRLTESASTEMATDPSSTGDCQRCSVLQSLQKKEPQEWEEVHVTPDGKKRYLQFLTSPIRNENGEVEQIVELVQDVTDRRRMQEQIEHEERMAGLGRLASGIMHEIGNPLSSISARLRRLKEKTDEDFTLETVEFLEDQINRLNRLIRDISSFARAPEPAWEPCRADHLIDEVTTLLELDQDSSNVEIETDFRDQSPFLASGDQLSQVFLNLGLNALEAMPDGGTLTISSWQEDDRVYFSFSDTGKGIPPEDQDEIFTPYYSSGKREDGTGLGLSIVHSFIRAHGGDIDVSSVPGEGSTFTVWVPYHDPDAQSTPISPEFKNTTVTS